VDGVAYTGSISDVAERQAVKVSAAVNGTAYFGDNVAFFENESAYVITDVTWEGSKAWDFHSDIRWVPPTRQTRRHQWRPFLTRTSPVVEFFIYGGGTGSGATFAATFSSHTDAIGQTYKKLSSVAVTASGGGYPVSGMTLRMRITNGACMFLSRDATNPYSKYAGSPTSGYVDLPFTLAATAAPQMTAYINPGVSHTRNAVFAVTFSLTPGTEVYEIDTITIVDGGEYYTGFTTLPITLVPSSYDGVIFSSDSWRANLTAGVVTSVTAPDYKGVYRGSYGFASVDAATPTEDAFGRPLDIQYWWTGLSGDSSTLACKAFPSGWSDASITTTAGPSQGDTFTVDTFVGPSYGTHVQWDDTRRAGEPTVNVSIE
jgi:hypothetical protein